MSDPRMLVEVALAFVATLLSFIIAAQCSAQVRADALAALREAATVSCWAEAAAVLLALTAIAVYALVVGVV